MKLYEKIINGEQHCKPSNKIVIVKDGMQTINPTEEMLFEDGWKVHEPVPYEPTEEEILNREKEYKIEELLRYDSSNDVNCFYIDDQEMWLDKATRVGLKLRFESELEDGEHSTVLWYNGFSFKFGLETVMLMLRTIERYASKCYDNTQRHISLINSLSTIEEIQNYNYRVGYPEKLRF